MLKYVCKSMFRPLAVCSGALRSTLTNRPTRTHNSMLIRHFRSTSTALSADNLITESAFHDIADKTLHDLETAVTPLDDVITDGAFDVSLSMGVLTVKLGKAGTYLLNKQTPNRQIWWSSPVSGPKRYEFNVDTKRWVNTRDGSDMLGTLQTELKQLVKAEITLE